METILFILATGLVVVIFVLLSDRRTRRKYRTKWMSYGRFDRDTGIPHFESRVDWIQKYYDEGYYERDKK